MKKAKDFDDVMEAIYNAGEKAGIKTRKGFWTVIGIIGGVLALIIIGTTVLMHGFGSGVKKK